MLAGKVAYENSAFYHVCRFNVNYTGMLIRFGEHE